MKSDHASGAKLSFVLYADYKYYKKSTGVLEGWLIDNGGACHIQNHSLVSVKQMIHLARVVKAKYVALPKHVLPALRSCIQERGKITDFFKSRQEKGPAHEYEITRSRGYFTSV